MQQVIQWFPGHMTKALRMMEENIKLCDAVIYVLDARAPFACINKKIDKLIGNKPCLYLLNKCDLVTSEDIKLIKQNFFSKNIIDTIGVTQQSGKSVYKAIINLLQDKIDAKKQKGITLTTRVMVCGIPNTGKSTIINSLSGKKQAMTGDKAGVTKGKQWVRLENIELLDTPGTMPPSFDNQTYAHHLAYLGSINDDILDLNTLLLDFIEELKKSFSGVLSEKYGVDESLEPIKIYEEICKKRGYLIKGGYDYTRCSHAVFDDFRKGKLGKLCLGKVMI